MFALQSAKNKTPRLWALLLEVELFRLWEGMWQPEAKACEPVMSLLRNSLNNQICTEKCLRK